MEINYKAPGKVAKAFLLSTVFVRGLRGPFGSGKSVACCIAVFMAICQQAPGRDGIRRTRWAIVRNTYAELRDTTIKTWTNWFPEDIFGSICMNPPPFRQIFTHQLGDGTIAEAEILFMALDRPEDVKKLLSLELTGAWINEAREVPKTIIDGITGRLRRYPSQRDGGPTWTGLIMDTNSPDDDHWWSIMSGASLPPESMTAEDRKNLIKPASWEFFTQPAAMLEIFGTDGTVIGYSTNPEAENLANLDPLYYSEMITGKSRYWINVYVMNRIGSDFDGRKVHPQFVRETHVSDVSIPYTSGYPLIGGVDFGLTPACIFEQFVLGQWRMLREIVMDNSGAEELADEIDRVMAAHFPDVPKSKLIIWGDPAGDSRVGTDKATPFQILRGKGFTARPTETNDPEIRRASMSNPIKRMVNGQPGFIISGPDCPMLVKGLDGGWHYPRIKSSMGEVYADAPAKNRFSHPCEAGEYGMQGGGEGRLAMQKTPRTGKQANGRVRLDPLDRLRRDRKSVGSGLRSRSF